MATERIWIRYHPWTVNFTVLVIDEFGKSAPNKDWFSYNLGSKSWTVSVLSLRPSRTVRQKLSRLTLTHENQFSSSVNSISSFSSCYQRNKNLPKKNINTRRDRKLKIMLSEKRPSCEVLYSSDFVDELSQAGFHIINMILMFEFDFIDQDPRHKETRFSTSKIWTIVELK